jgi:hypothetical protein
MELYKDWVRNSLIGKKVHFMADCIIKLDVIGIVIGTEMSGSEIIYKVDTGSRVLRIGENTTKLCVELL